MTPQNPKRHTQAEIDTAQGRDLPHYVSNWPQPTGRHIYTVTCKRRSSPGTLSVEVRADDPGAAMTAVRNGQAPGIGLGWLPLNAVFLRDA